MNILGSSFQQFRLLAGKMIAGCGYEGNCGLRSAIAARDRAQVIRGHPIGSIMARLPARMEYVGEYANETAWTDATPPGQYEPAPLAISRMLKKNRLRSLQ